MTSALETQIGKIVNTGFAAECNFLAEVVKVPTDNPPGDCAAHAQRVRSGRNGARHSDISGRCKRPAILHRHGQLDARQAGRLQLRRHQWKEP